MARTYWLAKSEPTTYAWDRLVKEKKATWDGVRNFRARNNLRAMKKGDLVFFYHSNEGKDVVGVARVLKEAYADPTAKGEDWSVVDLEPAFSMTEPVTLAAIKANPKLAAMELVKQSRLSVSAVTEAEFKEVLAMGKTKILRE